MYCYMAELHFYGKNHKGELDYHPSNDSIPMFAAKDMDTAKQRVADEFPGYLNDGYRMSAKWNPIHIGGLHEYSGAVIYLDEIKITLYQYELEQIQYPGLLRLTRELFKQLDRSVVQF